MRQKLLLILLVLWLPVGTWASFTATTAEGVTMTFSVTNSSTKECCVYGTSSKPSIPSNYTGPITIPEEVNGYGVTSISNYAFYGCSGLTSVEIPNSVTSIGSSAFYNCKDLASVVIPNSVTSIGTYAFGYCNSLTTIEIPNNLTNIDSSTFYYCSGLASVVIPNSVTSIGNYAFYNCINLDSVVIPNSVTSIGDYAFYDCYGLTSVIIPNSVTNIGYNAFDQCGGLKQVHITNIEGWLKIIFGNYYSNPLRYAQHLYLNGQEVTSVTIPNTITKINNYVFQGGKELVSVSIPQSVTSIGENAFSLCTGLVSVNIPKGVTTIEREAFYGCTGLVSVSIPEGVTTIGHYAFAYCNGLVSMQLPQTIKVIGSDAFMMCSGIMTINIPEGVTTIGSQALSNTGLTSISIPSSIEKIEFETFASCDNLKTVKISEGVTNIENAAFYSCDNLSSINLPSTLTSIGSHAFSYCSKLDSIDIPKRITNIQEQSFYNTGITCLNIPSNINIIGNKAFSYCTKLKKIFMDEGVVTISNYAFQNCTYLDSISIPSTVTVIGNYAFDGCNRLTKVAVAIAEPLTINTSNFSNRANATLYVPKGSKAAYLAADYWKEFKEIVEMDDGINTPILNNGIYYVLDDKNGTATVVSGETAYTGAITIPSSITYKGKDYTVTSIAEKAFQNSDVTSVSIPESVTTIGDYAFDGCDDLTNVTVEWETPIAINNTVFSNIDNITLHVPDNSVSAYEAADYWKDFKTIADPIVFADNAVEALCLANWDADNDGKLYKDEASAVTSLGSVFAENTDITSFDELQYFTGLTSIGERAFYYCSNLTSVIIPDNVKTIGNRAFYVCSSLTNIHISAKVTSIEDRAFAYCSGLETIEVEEGNKVYDSRNNCNALIQTSTNTLLMGCKGSSIPEGVTIIAEGAFRGCAELESIEIPEGVTTIGTNAFRGCSELTSITLPSTITSIGNYAFSAFDQVYNLTTVRVGMTTPVTISEGVFPNRANSTLYVPKSCKAAYKAANYWKEFKEIKEIGSDAFTDISELANAIYMDERSVIAGTRQVLAIKLKNDEPIVGWQFDLELPTGVNVALKDNGGLMVSLTGRGKAYSLTGKKRSENVYRFTVISASNTVLPSGDGLMMNVTVDVSSDLEQGTYGVVFKNGELVGKTDDSLERIRLEYVVSPLNVVDILMGDVNADGDISIIDVVSVINYILGNENTNFVKVAADMNGDGDVTIADVVSIINYILNDNSYVKPHPAFDMDE